MKLTCDQIQQLLMDREYGEAVADSVAEAAIDAHLAGCSACREFQADIRSIHQMTHLEEPAPALHWARLQSTVDQAMAEIAARHRRELWAFLSISCTIVAAMVGLGILNLRWFVVLQAVFLANVSLIVVPLLWQRDRREGLL